MHRETLEIEHDQVVKLMAAIADKSELIGTLQNDLARSAESAMVVQLNKLAGADDLRKRLVLTKNLLDQVLAEIDKLAKLQQDCGAALDRCRAAFPAYTMYVTNGRLDVPPGGSTFSLASKDGVATAFESPSSQKQLDPMASLGAAQLARRFSRDQ